MSTRGKFITLEGCDGCGKSTQLALLSAYLKERGIAHLFTREPGGSKIAEEIRAMILNKDNKEMTDSCEALLYAAARVQHLEEKVLPALNAGMLVICDRYIDSSYAYQGEARGLGYEAVKEINRYATLPDLTIFLDVAPEDAFARKRGVDENDRMELQGLAFHRKVYEGYRHIAEREPERFIPVDSYRSAEEVHKTIVSLLKERGIV